MNLTMGVWILLAGGGFFRAVAIESSHPRRPSAPSPSGNVDLSPAGNRSMVCFRTRVRGPRASERSRSPYPPNRMPPGYGRYGAYGGNNYGGLSRQKMMPMARTDASAGGMMPLPPTGGGPLRPMGSSCGRGSYGGGMSGMSGGMGNSYGKPPTGRFGGSQFAGSSSPSSFYSSPSSLGLRNAPARIGNMSPVRC